MKSPRTRASRPLAESRSPVFARTPDADPWGTLDPSGEGLSVHNFLTTWMSLVSNGLRRTLTTSYVDPVGLTVSEWRLLSLIAHAGSVPFPELVLESTSDKALVSRTLKLLESRGLVDLEAEGRPPRRTVVCHITPQGAALHAQVIPLARRQQTAMLLALTVEERRVLRRALQKLHQACLAMEQGDGNGKDAIDD